MGMPMPLAKPLPPSVVVRAPHVAVKQGLSDPLRGLSTGASTGTPASESCQARLMRREASSASTSITDYGLCSTGGALSCTAVWLTPRECGGLLEDEDVQS